MDKRTKWLKSLTPAERSKLFNPYKRKKFTKNIITAAVCDSFKTQLQKGEHDFTPASTAVASWYNDVAALEAQIIRLNKIIDALLDS